MGMFVRLDSAVKLIDGLAGESPASDTALVCHRSGFDGRSWRNQAITVRRDEPA